ncbi:hypothetical protein RQP46_010143 [Phenoliferia psychrophenolica]
MQAWDVKKEAINPSRWCHLETDGLGNSTCDCSEFKSQIECVHTLLHQHDHSLHFSLPDYYEPLADSGVVLVLVAFSHRLIYSTRVYADALLSGLMDDDGNTHLGEAADDLIPDLAQDKAVFALATRMEAVSHAPRGAPAHCRIKADDEADGFPIFPSSLPTPPILYLDEHARCSCGQTRASLPDPTVRGVLSPFRLYTLTGTVDVEIETIPCPRCKAAKRRIGPDLVKVGYWNWNNNDGFPRETMDDFISQYTRSETSFIAFRANTIDRYKSHSSPHPFISDPTFRRAFFAFVRVLRLETKMRCPRCGPNCEATTWDGCVIGTTKKYATGNLRPPTHTDAESVSHPGVIPVPKKSLEAEDLGISKPQLKSFVDAMEGWIGREKGPRALPMPVDVTAALEELGTVRDDAERISSILDFVVLFAATERGPLRSAYRTLLRQIISDDMVLQIIPFPSYTLIDSYVLGGPATRELARLVPAVGTIFTALAHAGLSTPPPPPFISILVSLKARSKRYFTTLVANHTERVEGTTPSEPPAARGDYKITGSCYDGEEQRRRPKYPGLANDGGAEKVVEMDSCRKFYAQYGKKSGIIGGICGGWCPHGVCVGFHFMPHAEGRNDIFSALLTFWAVAPLIIIYDFACQLAQYCMVREPLFFKNSRFYVDELHAHGHTSCSSACFLAPAMKQDPSLRTLNSSAAECAHGTLARTKKSLSYMNEEHGLLFMWVMIQVWNRRKIAALES